MIFDETGCSIYNKQKDLVAIGELHENMYRLKIQHRKFQQCMQTSASSANIWHRRLGHLNDNALSKMRNGTVDGIEIQGKIDNKFNCITCCEGKQAKQPFNISETRAKSHLDIIHTDIWGKSRENSIGGARYFLSFVDDFSRMVFVYFLKKKARHLNVSRNSKAWLRTNWISESKYCVRITVDNSAAKNSSVF